MKIKRIEWGLKLKSATKLGFVHFTCSRSYKRYCKIKNKIENSSFETWFEYDQSNNDNRKQK